MAQRGASFKHMGYSPGTCHGWRAYVDRMHESRISLLR